MRVIQDYKDNVEEFINIIRQHQRNYNFLFAPRLNEKEALFRATCSILYYFVCLNYDFSCEIKDHPAMTLRRDYNFYYDNYIRNT